ncbi:MAG: tRNA (N(6)-L-threonylcarbamoyladenosine(37)-C(2))-methylthiotransferase MtaB [Treponema sp.]|jgi:threonylcarbamoyladenosine tRNA methylthiotransferase MtaB|nr:tRNA (N(6)-L-threonylcarbamoyladenosine(37)-C(2))-methylthiotransferase MtaB [Treponema sp.]
MPSIAIATLGCKLNQLESEAIAASFKAEGFSLVPWPAAADILVINTCTVTSKAEQKARRIIRKALKDSPDSLLIVTGCYAQLDGPALAALEGELSGELPSPERRRLVVVPGDLKSALLGLPRRLGAAKASEGPSPKDTAGGMGAIRLEAGLEKWREGPAVRDPFIFNSGDFSFHSRSFLKIQDGCDHACSYCRVTLARGKSVSLESGTALTRLRELEDRGYGEMVLTGVNINQYRDAGGQEGDLRDLPGLLDFLLRGTSRIALRLSSLDPQGVSPELLAVLKNPRIRPHFHLSVQSGSGEILKRMRRWYAPEDVAAAVQGLRSCREDPFMACDIIAGFPGETGAEFQQTYDLCKSLDFAWIHAFPYSRRPGTEAAALKSSVNEADITFRVEALLNLARRGRERYARRWLGKTLEVLTEAPNDETGPYIPAVSENYLKLAVPIPDRFGGLPPGTLLRCRIAAIPPDAVERFDGIGEIVMCESRDTANPRATSFKNL